MRFRNEKSYGSLEVSRDSSVRGALRVVIRRRGEILSYLLTRSEARDLCDELIAYLDESEP